MLQSSRQSACACANRNQPMVAPARCVPCRHCPALCGAAAPRGVAGGSASASISIGRGTPCSGRSGPQGLLFFWVRSRRSLSIVRTTSAGLQIGIRRGLQNDYPPAPLAAGGRIKTGSSWTYLPSQAPELMRTVPSPDAHGSVTRAGPFHPLMRTAVPRCERFRRRGPPCG